MEKNNRVKKKKRKRKKNLVNPNKEFLSNYGFLLLV